MRHLVVGTAGHIDHGKSTLVRALTGIDPDRLQEEKARGITIELGFAHAVLDGVQVAFVDVPGHERFVRTMLAGAGGMDLVMLIVAADESVMPQTREHFEICRLLRVAHGVVVLTKADLVDAETLELVRLEVRDLVAGSFLDGAPVIPVSAATGAGLPALVDALTKVPPPARAGAAGAGPRLPIDRAFTMKGFGTVVTGTLVRGAIVPGQTLALLPGDREVQVRGMQVHGASRDEARAGQRVAVNLGGLEVADVARGQTLAAPGTLAATRRADVTLELLDGARALRHGARVRVHQGTAEVLARVSLAGPGVTEMPAGARGFARLRFEAPAVVTRGDRFIVRAYSPPVTIGGGQVLDPAPPKAGARTASAPRRYEALAIAGDEAPLAALAWMVAEAGSAALPVGALVWRAGLSQPASAAAAQALVAGGDALAAGDWLVAPATLTTLEGRVLTLLAEHHRVAPLSEGLPREEVRERAFRRAPLPVFELALARLATAGKVSGGARLALASHRVELPPEEARALEQVEGAFRAAGLAPPDLAGVAAATGLAPALVEKVVTLLARRRQLVKVDALYFHQDALVRLKSGMAERKAAAGGGDATVDVASFKERYGVSRKFAIPLLEYLDRERVTRRRGDVRVIL